MAKAQLGSRLFELDAAVGIGNEFFEQITLAIGLTTTIEFAGAMLDVPKGVVNLPHAVEVIDVEEVHDVCFAVVVGVELEESHLHEVVVEVLLVDNLLYDIGILEDDLHQAGVTQARGGIGIVGLLGLGRHVVLTQLTVLVVQVPLVALRGFHGNLELGAYLQHLHGERTHRLDATGYDGADGRNPGTRTEHLGEVLNHAAADVLQLLLAIAREFAPTALGVAHDVIHIVEDLLASRCQLVERVGLLHHPIWDIVTTSAIDVTRAMTSVMRDIKGLLASRGRGEHGGDGIGIGVVVARGV